VNETLILWEEQPMAQFVDAALTRPHDRMFRLIQKRVADKIKLPFDKLRANGLKRFIPPFMVRQAVRVLPGRTPLAATAYPLRVHHERRTNLCSFMATVGTA
jgi:hypothetical protein